MTKAECFEKAAAARNAATVAAHSAALYASAFGTDDALAQSAFNDAAVAANTAARWQWLAEQHPMTRAATIRQWSVSFTNAY
jgi:hypothetical protein